MAKQVLITGELERGKTTLCRHLVIRARAAGWRVRGVLSPGVFEGSCKTAIDLIDLATHEKRRLALRETPTGGPHTERWHFIPETLDWGEKILNRATPCDLLVVDELGPLELVRGEGWQAGIEAVNSRSYKLAGVVIRPTLLDIALEKWPSGRVYQVFHPGQAEKLAAQIWKREKRVDRHR
jgi:nucleoside-triphosphatase THEP1